MLGWADKAGFDGTVHRLERLWRSTPDDELSAIEKRTWPAIRELDEQAVDEVTAPAVRALRALPATDHVRRAVAEMIVFRPR